MSAPSRAGSEVAEAILTPEIGEDTSAAGLADAFVRTINRLDRRLGPIIGELGCAALFVRALYLAQQDQPFLQGVTVGSLGQSEPLPGLRQAVDRRDPPVVREGIVAVLAHFCDLLTLFLGANLVKRLCSGGSSVDAL